MLRRLALLILLVAVAACDEATANPLVGQWEASEQGVRVTFHPDGTLAIEAKDGPQQGGWSAEGEQLVMTLMPPGASEGISLTCLYKVEGDGLTIRPGDPRCGESSFRRVP
jgi:hypothetical protein